MKQSPPGPGLSLGPYSVHRVLWASVASREMWFSSGVPGGTSPPVCHVESSPKPESWRVDPRRTLYNSQAPSCGPTAAAAAAKSFQSCPTLCDPIDGSPPGSPIPGILQARTLEWVAISFSNAWKWKVKVKSISRVRLLATPWTAAYQAPPSMGFSRQEYWSGVPLPSPESEVMFIKILF